MHRQSFTIEVCVIDKNDNMPTFKKETMRGSVQLGLLKGARTGVQTLSFLSLTILSLDTLATSSHICKWRKVLNLLLKIEIILINKL